jgi:hypothetical protein
MACELTAQQADRIAVGRGVSDRIGADVAARAAAIVDDELLAGKLGQLLADDAREHVRGAAGGKEVDVLHRLGGPVVGGAGDTAGDHRRGQCATGQREGTAARQDQFGHRAPQGFSAVAADYTQ